MRYIVVVVSLLLSFLGSAQIGGDHTYQFLTVVTSPRIAGTAGTAIANTENDAVFAFWNPSLLRKEMDGQIVMSYANMASDINMGEAMYTYSLDTTHNFLIGFKYLNYGNFLLTNQNAQVLGEFTASDFDLQMSYSYTLSERWRFGTSLKVINSSYESYNSWGLATDFGATYLIPKNRFAMALVLKNLGFQANPYAENRESIPFEIQYSISNRFEHLPFRWMVTLEHLEQLDLTYNDPNNTSKDPITGAVTVTEPNYFNKILRHVVIGAELAPSDNFNIQLGYGFRTNYEMRIPTRRSSAGLTFGLGFRISKFRINYANTNMNVAGRMHHLSITTSLSKFSKSPQPSKEEQL